MPDQLKEALTKFVAFARSLRGDEKSEAQTFLDHFFRSLGHAGVVEAGATFKPIFENNRVEGTRRAADTMARVFQEIVFRCEPRERAQRSSKMLFNKPCPV